ncbi:MAG: DUF1289 domain-containing protein [Enterobacterales bacterium]|nr:DUF1289 domain-containing protein [Enterobacterales bacterium]
MQPATVPSPCIRVCTLDDADICMGCYRSMDEILAWGPASNDERQTILVNCEQRAADYAKRYPNQFRK